MLNNLHFFKVINLINNICNYFKIDNTHTGITSNKTQAKKESTYIK